jgi:site-specific recombinase XerD
MKTPRKRRQPKPKPADWTDALTGFGRHLVDHERSQLTQRDYRADLLEFTRWYQDTYQERPVPALIQSDELRAWKAHLRDQHELLPNTINRKLAALRSFLAWCASQGLAPEIPTPRSERQQPGPPRWLTPQEQRALVRGARRYGNLRDEALVLTLLDTGIRIDEAAELQRRDLELHPRSGWLTVRRGKGRKRRRVPLGPRVRDALRQYLRTREDDLPAVFVGQRGPLKVRALELILHKLNVHIGIPDLSPHKLRHTFLHDLAVREVPLQVIADLAGHESLETTRRYVQPGQDELAAAVAARTGGEDD